MSNEESTVFWRDTQGNEIPFISKEIDPKITGVLIVCQGGDNEAVRKEITESLQALFDLDAHKIKVAKMVTAR
jgi:stage III sporulation protein AG